MGKPFWKSFKESIHSYFDFILDMDQHSMMVIEEGFQLVWQDICSFFAD
jgi:hypothetical protein